MPLPASGAISMNDVNVELGCGATSQRSLDDAPVRTLFGKASGQISMSDGWGKSNFPTPTTLGTYNDAWGGHYIGTYCGYYLFATQTQVCRWWKTALNLTSTAVSVTDGYANTRNTGSTNHPAFGYAIGLSCNGFSDWFVASRDQLCCQYVNRTCGSIAAYCTSLTNGVYWSSTNPNTTSIPGCGAACVLDFYAGLTTTSCKLNSRNVRPIRRIAI